MKIDLFYEFCQGAGMPFPHGSDRTMYLQVLEQAETADQAGFGTFWSVEHHGSVEVTHMPAPEMFLTAVAMRTKDLKVGHAVVLTHPRFNHPIRVAERASMLDNLSGGRLEMGFGRSTPREWTIFGIDPDSTRPILEEVLQLMPRIWTEYDFSHESDYFTIAPITLVPRPYTQPHPPMWIAATSDESFALAGRSGVGVLGLTLFRPVADLAKSIQVFREAQKDQKPVSPFAVNNRTGAFTSVYVAPTLDEVIHSGAPQAAAWYLAKVFAYYGAVPVKDGEGGQHFAFDHAAQIAAIEASGDSPGRQALLKIVDGIEVSNEEFYEAMNQEDQFIMGTPEQVIKKLEHYESIGLDHLMCMMQGGPSLPHEKIVQSMKLMGETVIPYFKEKEKRQGVQQVAARKRS